MRHVNYPLAMQNQRPYIFHVAFLVPSSGSFLVGGAIDDPATWGELVSPVSARVPSARARASRKKKLDASYGAENVGENGPRADWLGVGSGSPRESVGVQENCSRCKALSLVLQLVVWQNQPTVDQGPPFVEVKTHE